MSAHSNGLKFSFGGFIKSLFGGSSPNDAETDNGDEVATSPAQAPSPASAQHYAAMGNGHDVHAQVFNRRPGNGSNGGPGGDHDHGTGRLIQISLQSIVCVMPPELRGRVRQAVADGLMITVSIEKILPQLAHGSVKIPFGDIRRAAPHIFATAADADGQMVALPLGEILPLLKPSMLPRRQAQKHTEVSEDIVGPFGAGAQGVTISSERPAPAPAPAPRPLPRPEPRVTSTRQVLPPQSIPSPFQRVHTPQPAMPSRQAIHSMPEPPLAPSAPIRMTPAMPATRQPEEPAPTPISPIAPASQPIRVVPHVDTAPPLIVPLVSLIGSWPEIVRQEVAQLDLAQAQIAIPASLAEAGLKRGRVAFQWKVLRSWIRPAPLPSLSTNDSTELMLPLGVIAPLFLARRNGGAASQKVAVDENIPNLFFGFPQAEAPAAVVQPAPQPAPRPVEAPAAKPADTNYYVWNDSSDTARVEEETNFISKASSNTDFKSRHATPDEIIKRAASLEGVAGTLIALPDGLKVASQIPADLNGDTLAAFLPQLFNKMSQCTRELRMGELNNLNFTVGNVPWKIFRVNAVFFAAFGRVGQPLPTAQLAALAGLLDRKNK